MIYIGIDPGKKGALAQIGEDGIVGVAPWDPEQYRAVLGGAWLKNNCVACLRDEFYPYELGTSVAPFDENQIYPVQGLVTKYAFQR